MALCQACDPPREAQMHQTCDRCGDPIHDATRVLLVDTHTLLYADVLSAAVEPEFIASERIYCCIRPTDIDQGLDKVRGPRPQGEQWR